MEENPIIRCPYCKKEFDFTSLSKNEWCAEDGHIIVTCPYCGKIIKIKIEEN